MAFSGMNYWAIVAAAAASFIFGGVWYTVLSKPWMIAIGKTETEIKARGMTVPMAITIVGQLVMAWILAGVIGHAGAVTVKNGLISGGLCFLGFVAPSLVVNYAFQGSKPALTLIDGAHWLGVLLIQGAVIGLIGVR